MISTVSLSGDRIVAHASLLMRGFGSTQHVGRLRFAVLPEFRHQRLGEALVGRDDGDARGVAFGQPGEEVGFGQHRGFEFS